MDKLVGETQIAFIKGRQILDGALIANEVVRWIRKKKTIVMLMKLDFNKAYDPVKWAFRDQVCVKSIAKSVANGFCHRIAPFCHRKISRNKTIF